jgi:hypothetical protein
VENPVDILSGRPENPGMWEAISVPDFPIAKNKTNKINTYENWYGATALNTHERVIHNFRFLSC